jgi:hypothetical protein
MEVQEHVNGIWSPAYRQGAEYLVHIYASSDVRTEWRARYTRPGEVGPWTTGRVWSPDGFTIDGHISPEPAPQPPSPPAKVPTITTVARFWGEPWCVALDKGETFYIAHADQHNVKKISAADSSATVIAGTGQKGDSGDGGPATQAELRFPMGVACDGSGNLYIADPESYRVRRVSAADGKITTFAGTGHAGNSGDGGPAAQARLGGPRGLVVDELGNLYIGDQEHRVVRKVSVS